MKRISLAILTVVGLSLFRCTSPIDSFKQIQVSLEKSNALLKSSNVKKLKAIHRFGAGNISSQADSIYYATEDLNGLIDQYKKRIENLDLIGSEVNVAYDVIATPDLIKGALTSATSILVARHSKIEIEKTRKKHLDSLIHNMVQAYADSAYFTKHFKGVPSPVVLAELSKMQLESSEITNISLTSLHLSLAQARPSYSGGVKLLLKYFTDEIDPILNKCIAEPKAENFPKRLKMVLTIDEHGAVTNVAYPDNNLSVACNTLIRKKIQTMKGWSAPIVSGEPIVSKYTWNISCLL